MDTNTLLGALALVALAAFGYGRMIVSGRRTRRLQTVLSDATIVDVRDPGEFRDGHYPGAMNIPVAKLDRSAGRLRDKSAPVVLYCASGSRARQAARILRSQGYRSVHIAGTQARLTALAG